jgi:hypothetical protein
MRENVAFDEVGTHRTAVIADEEQERRRRRHDPGVPGRSGTSDRLYDDCETEGERSRSSQRSQAVYRPLPGPVRDHDHLERSPGLNLLG